MQQLKKCDPCRVRLSSGEVVEAEYGEPDDNKEHWVLVGRKIYLASKINNFYRGCRFVGNPCELREVENDEPSF